MTATRRRGAPQSCISGGRLTGTATDAHELRGEAGLQVPFVLPPMALSGLEENHCNLDQAGLPGPPLLSGPGGRPVVEEGHLVWMLHLQMAAETDMRIPSLGGAGLQFYE